MGTEGIHERWNRTLDEMKEKGWEPRSDEEERELRSMYADVGEMYEADDLSWRHVLCERCGEPIVDHRDGGRTAAVQTCPVLSS